MESYRTSVLNKKNKAQGYTSRNMKLGNTNVPNKASVFVHLSMTSLEGFNRLLSDWILYCTTDDTIDAIL